MRQVFVVGTGRSGTTWMTEFLGSHPDVYALGWESRMIVDPGGFEDLVPALTLDYTPYRADDAMQRLSHILGERVTGRSMDAFRGWGLVEEIGPDRYWPALDELWHDLTWYEFDEIVLPGAMLTGQTSYLPHERLTNRRVVGRHFDDRSELVELLRRFLARILDPLAEETGAGTWVEKTPLALHSTTFLWELFPQARVVHMIRDPLSVVGSHLGQTWAPSTVDDAISWVEPIYRRWLTQRESLLDDERYVECRIEDLAADWPPQRAELLRRLDLPPAGSMLEIDTEAALGRTNLTSEERTLVLERLGDVRALLDYS